MRLRALPAVAVLAAGLLAAPASAQAACTTSAAQGSCGPYNSYPGITGTTSSTYIGNDIWNPVPRASQTLTATSPGNWDVTADMPAGNTAVVSYPSIGANYGQITDAPSPLTGFSLIRAAFTETMNATAGTSAWAAFDVWLGSGTSPDWQYEVMIQHDFAGNGPCPAVAHATFPSPAGPQGWDLCQFGTGPGSELVWKLTDGSSGHPASEQAGTVHILDMLRWLQANGYLPSDAGLWSVGYGWEICSTGGQPETFQVSGFTLHVKPA